VGYSFRVRPGVAVDTEVINNEGKKILLKGVNVSLDPPFDTRNLGVFLLYDGKGDSVTRVEIYNLDRPQEFYGIPVYWLRAAENEESLSMLQALIRAHPSGNLPEVATMAIAMHDDPQVGSILRTVVSQSTAQGVRQKAVFWLAQVNTDPQFFDELARDEQENVEVRKQAAFAIGVSKDKAALSILRTLYDQVADHQVKMHIIFAASLNENKSYVIDFLNRIAIDDTDPEARKLAAFWLGQKTEGGTSNKFSLKYRPNK